MCETRKFIHIMTAILTTIAVDSTRNSRAISNCQENSGQIDSDRSQNRNPDLNEFTSLDLTITCCRRLSDLTWLENKLAQFALELCTWSYCK